MRQVRVVLAKELLDSFRDKRALSSILLSILVGPLITAFMMNRIADRQKEADDVRIPIVGARYAPALVQWLSQQSGVTVVPPPVEPEQAVREQSEYVVLVVPSDYADDFRASRPASIKVIADSARSDTRAQVERVQRLLQQYNGEIGALRLIGRGVSPAAATPLKIQGVEVSTTQQRAAKLLSVIPLMVLLAAFTGAMQLATDATAGERERGSLEPLLMNPTARSALVAGKWAAVASIAMLIAVLSSLSFLPAQWLLRSETLAALFQYGPREALLFLALLLPFAAALSAVLMAVAIRCRTFKEAQASSTIVVLSVSLLPLVTVFDPGAESPWQLWVPALAQNMLMTRVLKGEALEAWPVLVPLLVCLVLTVTGTVSVARALRGAAVR
jgi:sodium transport system permease protein